MGVYRWYLLFSLIVYSAFSFASVPSASDKPTSQQCLARPELTSTTMTHSWEVGDSHYSYYQGCEYVDSTSTSSFICITIGADGYYCNWKTTGRVEPSDSGDSGDSGGGSDEPSNPDITPPVIPPVKPDTSSVGQLFELYSNCISDLARFPLANYDDYNPAIDYNYNARAKQCNSIYDNMSSLVTTNSMLSPSDDNHQFLTKDGSGNLYSCRRNPYTPQEWADVGKLYPGEILGNQVIKAREREIGYNCRIEHDPSDDKDKNRCNFHLNFNYGTDNGKGTTVCNSVYNANSGSGDSGTGSPGGSCPAGHYLDDNLGCLPVSSYPCNAGSHPDLSGSGRPVCVPDSGSGGDTDSGDDNGPGLSTPSLDVPELTLSPLWNIWPSARDFKLSLPAAQCPVFNIEVFGTNHKIDTFCTLFTPDIIAIIRAICILTASIISFIIVLRS